MIIRKIYYTLSALRSGTPVEEPIDKFQERRISDILEFAHDYYPTYRSLWEAENFGPEDFEELEDLREAPVIERSDVSGIGPEGVPLTVSRKYSSTGTTDGDVMEVPFEEQAADWTEAVTLRTEFRNGYRPMKKMAEYWGLPQTRIGDLLRPKVRVPKDSTIKEQAELLLDEDPDFLIYGAHILFRVAKHLESRDEDLSVEKVFNNGELLTLNMRQKIESVLDTSVVNVYETAEFGQVAFECPEGGYHVNQDLVHHEVLDDEGEQVGEGETGEIVLTGLVNRAKLLVRYRTGDLVEKEGPECSCDTVFSKIGRIQGRKKNVVENSDGEKVYPRQIIDVLAGFDELSKFVFIREDGENRVEYESRGELDEGVEKDIRSGLSDLGLEEASLERKDTVERINWKAAPVRNRDE